MKRTAGCLVGAEEHSERERDQALKEHCCSFITSLNSLTLFLNFSAYHLFYLHSVSALQSSLKYFLFFFFTVLLFSLPIQSFCLPLHPLSGGVGTQWCAHWQHGISIYCIFTKALLLVVKQRATRIWGQLCVAPFWDVDLSETIFQTVMQTLLILNKGLMFPTLTHSVE